MTALKSNTNAVRINFQTYIEPSTPRLTKQALASHNKSQTKGNTCFNSENDEELKSSRSDTEVELNVENYGKERRKSTPRRGQSLSPPHKRAPLRERSAAYVALY
jgi:hypothetical protein